MNILLTLAGFAMLLVGLFLNWAGILGILGLPRDQLQNLWVRRELVTVRMWCTFTGTILLVVTFIRWKSPPLADRLSNAIRKWADVIERVPLAIPLALTALVLAKSVLQLCLYMSGYAAYGADDFTRTISADYWLRHWNVVPQEDGWLGFASSVWLPLPDYLFGLGLAVHRDLFFTPRIENLILSGVVVVAAYFLGRELFGRTAGFLTATLVALQPWHVWLGFSGMTSDLPSILFITVFAAFVFRWLETDRPRALLAAASALGLAQGFRHEGWCFGAAFSLFLVWRAVARAREGRLTRQWLTVVAVALTIMNAFPVFWMARTFYLQGDVMPHLSWSPWRSPGPAAADAPEPASGGIGYLGMPLLAGGAFPLEFALSIAAVVLVLKSDARRALRQYLIVLAASVLSLAIGFKGQMAASIVFLRYLLPFVVVLLPYAGGLLAQLVTRSEQRRNHAALTSFVIVTSMVAFDVLRSFNYPSQFPVDAIDTGWHLRALQETGTLSPDSKILIERAEDWVDLGIVALANKPERFVVLNERAFRQTALLKRSANRPTPIPPRVEDGVRGSICGNDFQVEACRNSVLKEGFDVVILSSPARIASFRTAIPAVSRSLGRYWVFDLRPERPAITQPRDRR